MDGENNHTELGSDCAAAIPWQSPRKSICVFRMFALG